MTLSRARGALLGLAVGDAVGTTLEFQPRGTFAPITDMEGGGPFDLMPGQWTDDTSMALCLGESLLECGGFDPVDQLRRYTRWFEDGYWSSVGHCFDVGGTVMMALMEFKLTGNAFSGPTHPQSAGNGSIMRLAPVVLHYHPDAEKAEHFAAESSRTTHGAEEAVAGCRILARMLMAALEGKAKEVVLRAAPPADWMSERLRDIAAARYVGKPKGRILGSGWGGGAAVASARAFPSQTGQTAQSSGVSISAARMIPLPSHTPHRSLSCAIVPSSCAKGSPTAHRGGPPRAV
ncbi:MAG TPA: ADP-ribosylglycohydrolase family protein [Longimicrobiales bacterium]|nr:ADP-ribosylglycohydrolase family protein [Longimicrobiales bacterium]